MVIIGTGGMYDAKTVTVDGIVSTVDDNGWPYCDALLSIDAGPRGWTGGGDRHR